MRDARPLVLLISLGALSFVVTVLLRPRAEPAPLFAVAADGSNAVTDSSRLAGMGFVPGRQLVAFVFGGSRCRPCSSPEMTKAVRSLRAKLRESNRHAFSQTLVVGVAINTDLAEGMQYLAAFGLEHFDEISVGKGWLNENAIRWLWSDTSTEVAVPRIVLVSRSLSARLDPIELRFTTDSVVRVVSGVDNVVTWMTAGASVSATR